jgi:hypothetical protein
MSCRLASSGEDEVKSAIAPYLTLLEHFTNGAMSAQDFEAQFLKLFKNDTTDWSDVEYAALDELFGAVDAFCADPTLRDETDLDEQQLLDAGRIAMEKLRRK